MQTEIMNKAGALKNQVEKKIAEQSASFLTVFSPDDYLDLFTRYERKIPYNFIHPDIQAFFDDMSKDNDPVIVEYFHQLILIQFVIMNTARLGDEFPECITRLFFKNFIRILKTIEKQAWNKGFYLYPNDNFLKDLGVCSLRLIPAGNHKLDISAFSRSFMLKKGIRQLLDSFFQVMIKAGGNQPFYQFHTDIHDRDALMECNLKGTSKLYLRIAKLLEVQKDIKGVFGSSWMNDPQLETISPGIFSGPKLVRDNGGRLYYNGVTPKIAQGATFASPKRTRLYKQGSYKPANYMLLWLRSDILKWASRQEAMEI